MVGPLRRRLDSVLDFLILSLKSHGTRALVGTSALTSLHLHLRYGASACPGDSISGVKGWEGCAIIGGRTGNISLYVVVPRVCRLVGGQKESSLSTLSS